MGAPKWKKDQISAGRKWIQDNPDASISQTMRATGLSAGSISKIRKELLTAGLQKRRPHTPSTPAAQTTDQLLATPPPDAESVLAGVLPLTREQRYAKLHAIMSAGTPDQIIRANAEIEKMDRASQEEDALPTLLAPGTLDEAIGDAADVIEAVLEWGGEDAAKQVFTLAHTRWRQTQERLAKQAALQPQPEPEGAPS